MSITRCLAQLAASLPLLASIPAWGQVQLGLSQIGSGFNSPVFVAQPSGYSRWLYVVEQSGTVRVLRDGVRLTTPVVTISDLYSGSEAGLLGMAFHPAFASNGFVYFYYTSTSGRRVVRYTLDTANPETADPGSALVIGTFGPSTPTHDAGWIGFGPDGYLYVASGNGGDPGNSSDTSSFLGKLLRIDVDNDGFPADPLRNYAIPLDNPFLTGGGAPEVWAYGLRNPFRCSFDRQTGDLWIADVGDSVEEVDVQPAIAPGPQAARNYGYPFMEGTQCGSFGCCLCADPSLTLPVLELSHSYGDAILGGYVYRGQRIPGLTGTYLFAEYEGKCCSFRYSGGTVSEFTVHSELNAQGLSMGEDASGELYLCTTSQVFQIVPACYPNCDGSAIEPRLNISDFTCFLRRFAAGNAYANCDGSTAPPLLNVADFICFLSSFTGGCP